MAEQSAVEAWAESIRESLDSDKSNDWSEELAALDRAQASDELARVVRDSLEISFPTEDDYSEFGQAIASYLGSTNDPISGADFIGFVASTGDRILPVKIADPDLATRLFWQNRAASNGYEYPEDSELADLRDRAREVEE
jgi:hypothetical protein